MEPRESWQQLRDLFDEALKLEQGQRQKFVDQRCAGDRDLHRRLTELLRAHDEAHDAPGANTAAETQDAGPAEGSGLGTLIGPYRLLQRIGEGGFGVVYMAEQREPIVRRVAVKVIRPGMGSDQVIARFEAERQALALMDHPNIAQVFDAGATAGGQPYFAMELVRGETITEYCDSRNLTNRQRLELFLPVLRAVQHAHQKGVIHRDLKPSNVLVTLYDGRPTPKVIDFGIAKATAMRLTERTLFTEYGQFVGTPEYMSPEQAAMSGQDVDTRSDIYSLGALLYELLTGQKLFEPERLRSLAFLELLRIIREEEPANPSTRISRGGEAVTRAAEQRGVALPLFARGLRGEPDWIVMKALAKERSRRYDSADAFAADIERYLNSEPVAAGPPGARYRTSRFLRRHRVAAGVTAAVAVALLAGTLVATIGLVRARRAEAIARRDAYRNMLDLEAQRALRQGLTGDLDTYLAKTRSAIALLRESDRESPRELTLYLANLVLFLDKEVARREIWFGNALPALLSEIEPEAYRRVLTLDTPPDSSYLAVLDLMARCAQKRKPEFLVPLLRRWLEVRRQLGPLDADYVATSTRLAAQLRLAADSLVAAGQASKAELILFESLRVLQPIASRAPRALGETQGSLGACFAAQGRDAAAESLLIAAWHTVGTTEALQRLVDLEFRLGRASNAQHLGALSIVNRVRDLGVLKVGSEELKLDLGYSVRVGERELWLFSCTFRSGVPGGNVFQTQVHPCSQLWSNDLDARNGITFASPSDNSGKWGQYLPLTPTEAAPGNDPKPRPEARTILWPGPLVRDPLRHRTLIAYAKVLQPSQAQGVQWLGTSLAVLRDGGGDPVRQEVRPGSAEPTLLFQGLDPQMSAAGLVLRDTLYLYGRSLSRGTPTVVARAPLADALDRNAWQFWAGDGRWAAAWIDAKGILDTGSQFSVHWNAHLRKLIAVISAEDCDGVELRTADRPEGPWSPRLVIPAPVGRPLADTTFMAGAITRAGTLVPFKMRPHDYAALAHPGLSRDGGRIEYVTFSRPIDGLTSNIRLLELTFR